MGNSAKKKYRNIFFIFILLFLIASSTLVYKQFNALIRSNAWVTHTYKVIATNDLLLISLLDSNKLARDYFYSGEIESLQKYQVAVKNISVNFLRVKQLTHDNIEQQKILNNLEPLLNTFISSLQDNIKIYPTNHTKAIEFIHSKNHEKNIMEIKESVIALNQNEELLLIKRAEGAREFTHNTNVSFFLFSVSSYILIIFAFYLISINEKKHQIKQTETNRLLAAQNKKLLIANQEKDDFLGNISHELLTPLNGIIGFVEFIHTERAGSISKEQKEYLGDILSSSYQLLRLIQNILDIQQLESGKILLHPEPTHLSTLANEVCSYLHKFSEKKSIHVEINIDPTIENIIIDPGKIKKIIFHYLSNAIKFTKDGGKVTLRIHPETKEKLRIEVEDNGIGIREEDMKKLFLPFQQLDSPGRKKYQGVGLSLALTHRIVEALGGKTGVKSKVGKGSTFFAILPYTDCHK